MAGVRSSGALVDSERRVRPVGQDALARTVRTTAIRWTALRAWTWISFSVTVLWQGI
jgi:hypothetical protein